MKKITTFLLSFVLGVFSSSFVFGNSLYNGENIKTTNIEANGDFSVFVGNTIKKLKNKGLVLKRGDSNVGRGNSIDVYRKWEDKPIGVLYINQKDNIINAFSDKHGTIKLSQTNSGNIKKVLDMFLVDENFLKYKKLIDKFYGKVEERYGDNWKRYFIMWKKVDELIKKIKSGKINVSDKKLYVKVFEYLQSKLEVSINDILGYDLFPLDGMTIIEMMRDDISTTREVACYIVNGTTNPKYVAELTKLLEDENADVREAAALALGITEDNDAIKGLKNALDDEKAKVREAAIKSLGDDLGKDGVRKAIKGMLDDKEKDVVKAAKSALGELGSNGEGENGTGNGNQGSNQGSSEGGNSGDGTLTGDGSGEGSNGGSGSGGGNDEDGDGEDDSIENFGLTKDGNTYTLDVPPKSKYYIFIQEVINNVSELEGNLELKSYSKSSSQLVEGTNGASNVYMVANYDNYGKQIELRVDNDQNKNVSLSQGWNLKGYNQKTSYESDKNQCNTSSIKRRKEGKNYISGVIDESFDESKFDTYGKVLLWIKCK